MVLTTVKAFFCRSDVKIIIFSTITGGVLQILSKRYLKNHPEFLKDLPESKERLPRGRVSREGEVTTTTVALAQVLLAFLSEHGLTAGLISGTGLVISKLPLTAIGKYLNEVVSQNLSHLEKKNLSWLREKKYI